jgi:TrpR-related protein YerC/YecD
MKPLKNRTAIAGTLAQEKLYEALSLINSAQEAQLFLNDLCTPAELQAMADRWLVVGPVKAGEPYRKIHEKTNVSMTTISRVARFASQPDSGYSLIFDREKNKNKDL